MLDGFVEGCGAVYQPVGLPARPSQLRIERRKGVWGRGWFDSWLGGFRLYLDVVGLSGECNSAKDRA